MYCAIPLGRVIGPREYWYDFAHALFKHFPKSHPYQKTLNFLYCFLMSIFLPKNQWNALRANFNIKKKRHCKVYLGNISKSTNSWVKKFLGKDFFKENSKNPFDCHPLITGGHGSMHR